MGKAVVNREDMAQHPLDKEGREKKINEVWKHEQNYCMERNRRE